MKYSTTSRNAMQDQNLTYLPLPVYRGQPKPQLDAPFTLFELEAVLHKLTRSTTPDKDKIWNKLLRNLDHASIDHLLDYLNAQWAQGTIPPQWKHAEITLVPKPNKPLQLDKLRPISLTSCLGKLFEHLVYNRIYAYREDNHHFPDTMFGFHPHLTTPDII